MRHILMSKPGEFKKIGAINYIQSVALKMLAKSPKNDKPVVVYDNALNH